MLDGSSLYMMSGVLPSAAAIVHVGNMCEVVLPDGLSKNHSSVSFRS